MAKKFSYADYVHDDRFLGEYNDYQARYATSIRESDKVILALLADPITRKIAKGTRPSVLDIGCSTGNLLSHLNSMYGDQLELYGGDLAESSLDQCRGNLKLDGVNLSSMDVLDLPTDQFDFVIANAVLYMLDDMEYSKAMASLHGSLHSGGLAVLFDFGHGFAQEVEILERSKSHPDGLRLCFRSFETIRSVCAVAGFSDAEFKPFTLPIDLSPSEDPTDLVTYTRRDDSGLRMSFRGVLFQPWCHILARKARSDDGSQRDGV